MFRVVRRVGVGTCGALLFVVGALIAQNTDVISGVVVAVFGVLLIENAVRER